VHLPRKIALCRIAGHVAHVNGNREGKKIFGGRCRGGVSRVETTPACRARRFKGWSPRPPRRGKRGSHARPQGAPFVAGPFAHGGGEGPGNARRPRRGAREGGDSDAARERSIADLADGCLVGQSLHRRKVANLRNCKYLREPCTPTGRSPSASDVKRRQAFAAWCPCRFFARRWSYVLRGAPKEQLAWVLSLM
jgi:hypothetical protein